MGQSGYSCFSKFLKTCFESSCVNFIFIWSMATFGYDDSTSGAHIYAAISDVVEK